MPAYYLSSEMFTGRVETNSRMLVTDAAPVWYKFIGQPLSNLVDWLDSRGGLVIEEL